MTQPKEKNLVFIVSGGRTGTTFLGNYLSDIIEDTFSVHEPDLLDGFSMRSLRAIRQFGLYHMVIGRLLGKTGIRNLSQQFLAGELAFDDAVQAVQRHRQKYYASVRESLLVESYSQWNGLLPVLRTAFPACKIVGIVRDPRTWVRSWMNYGSHFDKDDMVERLGQRRLEPDMIGDQKYAARWSRMSPLAKNCWHWKVIAELMMHAAAEDEQTRLYRFEDLFPGGEGQGRPSRQMDDLLGFITSFDDRRYSYSLETVTDKQAANRSDPSRFPRWEDWTSEHKEELLEICGPLMSELGYSQD